MINLEGAIQIDFKNSHRQLEHANSTCSWKDPDCLTRQNPGIKPGTSKHGATPKKVEDIRNQNEGISVGREDSVYITQNKTPN